jgi:O-acetylserine/cysteine efflux transporter
MLVAGLGVLPLAFSDFVATDWGDVGLLTWAAVFYSTLVVAAFAFAAWQQGISRIGANRVLVYQYLIVLTGVISGVVLLGERLGANKLLGGAVILVGVYLARRQ